MVVTELMEVSKARSKVYIDNEFAFVLYKGELRNYQIRVGNEVAEEDYQEIMTKVLPKRAKLRCMNLLQSREYTEKQLRDKLRQGFYPVTCIDEAIAYVQSYQYVDDNRYARQFIEYNMQSKSRRKIENDLLQKGISRELIQNAFLGLEDEGIAADEDILINKWLKKKHFCRETASNQEKQKLFGFLYRKGFSMELIRKAIQADLE